MTTAKTSVDVTADRRLPAELSEQVARLAERAEFDGLRLTGDGGVLPELIKQAVEAALQGEMTAHLGYARYAAEGRGQRQLAERFDHEDGADRGRAGAGVGAP